MNNNFIDMTGLQFGRWKVIQFDKETTESHISYSNGKITKKSYWKCECQCENKTIKSILGQSLRNGKSKSCGCWNKERDRSYERLAHQKDMTGEIINYIKVISKNPNKNNKAIHWNCECLLCGSNFIVDGRCLRGKNSQFSCGCVKSKGEFKIAQILNNEKQNFLKQYKFSSLPNYFFDFALLDEQNNVICLIEFDGEQHFNTKSKYYSETMIEHDMQKNSFCIKNNIQLYRIPYWDYDKINDLSSLLRDEYNILLRKE